MLHTHDFGEWEAAVTNTLGHHRSQIRPGSLAFEAQIRGAQVDEFQVLWLHGTGQLELQREQCGDAVLWLPIQGLMQETINGEEYVAEPATALLFQPGDVMKGLSTDEVSGAHNTTAPAAMANDLGVVAANHRGEVLTR